jgi:hypothetical protein
MCTAVVNPQASTLDILKVRICSYQPHESVTAAAVTLGAGEPLSECRLQSATGVQAGPEAFNAEVLQGA